MFKACSAGVAAEIMLYSYYEEQKQLYYYLNEPE